MSGKKITDHSFFAGSGSPTFPKNNAEKVYTSAGGAGELGRYEDTTEAIKDQQTMAMGKIKANPMKPGYRN